MSNIFEDELQKMKDTLHTMDEQLDRLEKIPVYYGEDFKEQILESMRESNRQNLRIGVQEPYFGRLDFQEDGKEEVMPIYIGKVGVSDMDTMKPIIIDWRAPVASMFYSFTGGEELAFYQSPDGLVEGDVYLKRNISIRKRELERVVDTYVKGNEDVSHADDFLLYRLGENKDNKLKDIVSTIQSEQNDIIRAERNLPLLIQGVAGSGKTTIALHRLAFLIYEYREQLEAERMIVFAPNSLFLDYISSVLPELGVGNISQTTFPDWALRTLDDSVKLKQTEKKLKEAFSINRDEKKVMLGKLKGTLEFKTFIEERMIQFENELVPTKDFEAWDRAIIPLENVKKWMRVEYKHYPLQKRRERLVGRMKRWIEIELKKFGETNEKKLLKKEATKRLNAYMKFWPKMSALSLYSSIVKSKEILEVLPEELVKETEKSCRKKEVCVEDLPALIYIHHRITGIEIGQKFHHVVIDEAQDFSPFQVYVLKEITLGNSFTILGDLSQAIYDYQGIEDWNAFKEVFQETGYYELTRSYRSTKEIIEFANEIIKNAEIPVGLATPVFRSGEDVKVIHAENQFTEIVKTVKHLQNADVKTIAVIGRTEDECRDIYVKLTNAGLTVNVIEANQSKYEGGISVVPVYLAKGLEFDAVLLIDVDEEHYKNTKHDAKLLYVGCTRSLHDLWIFHGGEASPLIKGLK
ncbi:TPA: UvrD-helicase domain-containing protein [Bacillus cereus]|uniref:HelD family protein n=1 Tax=unclassified Bacillus (in: firmicutes) TaxID=185979 RepID=UPI0012624455|nr:MULTISPECIES: UvrD-helicase domain-containing protein [unclassified Bacillus (in: firmicutes)]MCX2703250.1 UvrD-helicase domain-containing protein [Bacillus sp. AS_5]HDR4865946.1 UvrD-helicase domain-containing protein [Bacillus cereus]KAB7679178.1 DNA helicase UvrD [Bacillus sp. B1-WWTP-T-0.5-Post-4]MCW4654536.1 UvrD-helicase domain-containing protein [Bacillus sp. AS_3]HDR4875339.1 UvrD-helicase domain-containing protein [Bacillus cereus]